MSGRTGLMWWRDRGPRKAVPAFVSGAAIRAGHSFNEPGRALEVCDG